LPDCIPDCSVKPSTREIRVYGSKAVKSEVPEDAAEALRGQIMSGGSRESALEDSPVLPQWWAWGYGGPGLMFSAPFYGACRDSGNRPAVHGR